MTNARKIITSKKDLKEWLDYELKRYNFNKKSLKSRIGLFFRINEKSILIAHQILLRKCEYFLNTKKKLRFLLAKIKLRKIQYKYGLYIPFNVFGKGLRIMHLLPILVNEKVQAGENCALHGNTSIVAAHGDFSPTLGNNVIVCVGAILLGGIKIADGVTVGAGAVVVKDAEIANSTLVGVPAHIVNK